MVLNQPLSASRLRSIFPLPWLQNQTAAAVAVPGLGQQQRVALEVEAQILPAGTVVRAAGDLDRPMPLEARPVARLDIAEIGASLIGPAVGQFLHVAVLAALVRELGQERGDAVRRVDPPLLHRRDDERQVGIEARAGSRKHLPERLFGKHGDLSRLERTAMPVVGGGSGW